MSALRPHQLRAVYQVETAWRDGVRRVLCVMPTGAGKTRTAAHIMRRHVDDGGRVLFVVHRQELVSQTRDALVMTGVDASQVRTLAGGASDGASDARVTVASVQTLLMRERYEWPSASLLVLDEAHHYASDEWCGVPREYVHAQHLGLTATPERGDGRAMGDLFERLVVPTSVKELTAHGVLVPCVVYGPSQRKRALAALPHEALLRHRKQWRRAVVFAANVEHALEVAQQCRDAGMRAAVITGNLDAETRARTLRDFREHAFDVLVNVFVLTEGFDDPAIDACVLARGCSHAGTFIQMVGRVIRSAPGKDRAIVLDLVGAVHDHGLPDAAREYSLEGTAIKQGGERLALRQCLACGAVYEVGPRQCERCGERLPPPPKPKLSREEMNAIMNTHTTDRRLQVWAQLKGVAKAKGYREGWARYQYRARYGEWPRWQ